MEVSEEAEDFSVSLHSAASSSSSTGNSKSDDDDSFPEVSDDGLEDATVPPEEDDKQMIGSKVPNTKRWKVFVFVVLCINTALVITATTLFLEHEENEEFETAVSLCSVHVQGPF